MFNFIVIGSTGHNITCAASDSEFIYFGTEKATIIKMNYALVNGERMTEEEIRSKVQIQGELKIPKIDKRIEKIICYPSYYLIVFLCNNTIYYADTRRITKSKQTDLHVLVEAPMRNVHCLFAFSPAIEPVFIKRLPNFDTIQSTSPPDLKKIILDTEYEVYSAYDKRFPLSQNVDRDPTHLPIIGPGQEIDDPQAGIMPKFGVLTEDNSVDFYQLVGTPTSLLKTKRYTDKYNPKRDSPGPLELTEFRHFAAIKVDLTKRGGVVDVSQIIWFGDFLIFTAVEGSDYMSNPSSGSSMTSRDPVRAYEYVKIPEQTEVKKKHDISVSRVTLMPETIVTFKNETTPSIVFIPSIGIPVSDRLKYYNDIKSRFDYMKGKDLEITDNPQGWYAGLRRSFALRFDEDTILPYKIENKKVVAGSGVVTLVGAGDLIAARRDSIMYISQHGERGGELKTTRECRFISLTTPDEKKQDSCLPTQLMESLRPSFLYTDISPSRTSSSASQAGSLTNSMTLPPGVVSLTGAGTASAVSATPFGSSVIVSGTSPIGGMKEVSSMMGTQGEELGLKVPTTDTQKDMIQLAHTNTVLNSNIVLKKTAEMRATELSVPPNTPFGFMYDKTTKLVLLIVKANVYQQINSILDSTQHIVEAKQAASSNDMASLITSIEECELAFSIALERHWISETAPETLEVRHKIALRLYDTQLYEKFFGHMLTVFSQLDLTERLTAIQQQQQQTQQGQGAHQLEPSWYSMTDNFIRSVFAHYSFADFMKALDIDYRFPSFLPISRWWERVPAVASLATIAPAFHLPLDVLRGPKGINFENTNISFGDLYPVSSDFAKSRFYFNFVPPITQSWSHLKQLLFWLYNTLADPKKRPVTPALQHQSPQQDTNDDVVLLYLYGLIVSGRSEAEIDEYVRTLNVGDVRLLLGTRLFRLAGKAVMNVDLAKAFGYMVLAQPNPDNDGDYFDLMSALRTALSSNTELSPSMKEIKRRLAPITSITPSFGGLNDILHTLALLVPSLVRANPLNVTNRQLSSFYANYQDEAKDKNKGGKTEEACNDVVLAVIRYLPYIAVAQSNTFSVCSSRAKASLSVSTGGSSAVSSDPSGAFAQYEQGAGAGGSGVTYVSPKQKEEQAICLENVLEGPRATQLGTATQQSDRKQRQDTLALCKGIRLGTVSGIVFALRPEYVHALFRASARGDQSIVNSVAPITRQELMNLISAVVLTIKIALDDTVYKSSGSSMERFLLSNVHLWNSPEAAALLIDMFKVLYSIIGDINVVSKIMTIPGSRPRGKGAMISDDGEADNYFEAYKLSLEKDIEEIYLQTRARFQNKLNVKAINEAASMVPTPEFMSNAEHAKYFSPFLPVYVLFSLIFKKDFKACVEAILGEYVLGKDPELGPDDIATQVVETEESRKTMRPEDFLFTTLKQSRTYRTVKLPMSLYLRAIGNYIYELIISLEVDEQRHAKEIVRKIQEARKLRGWLKPSSSTMFSNPIEVQPGKEGGQGVDGYKLKKQSMTLNVAPGLKLNVSPPNTRIEGHYSREQQAIRRSEFFRVTHLLDNDGLDSTSSLAPGSMTNVDSDADLLARTTENSCGWHNLCTAFGLLDAMISEAKNAASTRKRHNITTTTEGEENNAKQARGDEEDARTQYEMAVHDNKSTFSIHPVLPVSILHSLEAQLLNTDLKTIQFMATGDIPKMLQLISDDFPVLALEDNLRTLGELQAAQCGKVELRKNIMLGMQHVASVEREKRKGCLYSILDKSTRCAICGSPFEAVESATVLDGEIVHMSCYDSIPEFQ